MTAAQPAGHLVAGGGGGEASSSAPPPRRERNKPVPKPKTATQEATKASGK